MFIIAKDYDANGIHFLKEFPTGPLDWADSPHKTTLADNMPQIEGAYTNALNTIVENQKRRRIRNRRLELDFISYGKWQSYSSK